MDDSPTFEPRRILVIRRRAIGDIMVSLAVPAALKARWPQARIDMVVDRGIDAVAQGHSFLDDLVVYDARKVRAAGLITQVRLTIRWLRQLRRKRYDVDRPDEHSTNRALDVLHRGRSASGACAPRSDLGLQPDRASS